MKKNIIGIILLFIGVVLIALGILLPTLISSNAGDKPPKTENESEKNPSTVENKNNEQLKKQQCLENICINDLIITKQENIYSISATMENKRTTEILDTAINLIFTKEDGSTMKKTQYIQKLESNQTAILEIQFTKADEELMNVTSYKLEYATEQEKEAIKQSITD